MTRFKAWKKCTQNFTKEQWEYLEKKSRETTYAVNLIIRNLVDEARKKEGGE